MKFYSVGEIFSKFIDNNCNLGILSVDAGEEFSAKVITNNHSLVFVRKYEKIQLKINSSSIHNFIGPKSVFCVPAKSTISITPCSKNCSFTILSPATDHYRRIEKHCGITKKHFDEIFSTPLVISRKRWMDELLLRYVFELTVAKNKNNYVTKFLEIEIMKEIFYNFVEEKDSLRKEQFAKSLHEFQKEDIIYKAVIYIENNLFKMPSIRDIIKVVGASESSLYRTFIKNFSKSPQQYIKDRLLQEARILLMSGDYNVSDVAYMVGYNSASSFSCAFKKKFNIRPHELLHDEDYKY